MGCHIYLSRECFTVRTFARVLFYGVMFPKFYGHIAGALSLSCRRGRRFFYLFFHLQGSSSEIFAFHFGEFLYFFYVLAKPAFVFGTP